MLSYAEQVRMTEYLTSIYDQIELELLQSLASSFASSQYGGSTEWRAQMLERMGWYNRRNAAIIAKYSGKSQSAVEEIFRDLGAGALTHEETLYQTAFDRGLFPVRPVNPAESAAISQILDAAVDNADNYLNLVNTTCAECARSAYIDVVNKAYIETTTGIKDYTTSIRQAVNKLAKDGITTVTYYRRDGTAIRYPVDAAVRRNILTSIGQTTGKMQIARADEWGCNYMEVTSHAGARPSHAEWQGQVYQINGSSAEYDNLYDATGYGTGDGLKGWNCRHDMYPFIPGISVRGSFPIDLDENEREYNLTQEQRRLEREVRQLRRECVASDALGDKASFMKSSQQLKSKEAELKDFMERTDRTQAARVSTAGFGRSVSQKAVRANKKALQNVLSDVTIGNIQITKNSISSVPLIRVEGFSEKQNKQLQKIHRRLLKRAERYPVGTEASATYTMDLRELSVVKGTTRSTTIRSHDIPYIGVHNHPSGYTLGYEDVERFLLNPEMKMISAVGNNGNIYLLQKTEDYSFAEFTTYLNNSMINRFGTTDLQEIAQKFTPDEYVEFCEKAWKDAENYGFRYYTA